MAVIKAKPEKLVDFALALMARQSILPYVSTRVAGSNFEGVRGDTITLRIKGINDGFVATARDYEWRTRNAPIVLDDISAGGPAMPFTLNTHSYSATALTDEHFTLDDINFAKEVIAPQVEAVSNRLEGKAVTAFRAAHPKWTLAVAADDDPYLVALESRRLMDSAKVAPRQGRAFILGTDVAAAWLASDRLSKYDSHGLAGTPALRDAIIGKLVGSPVIEHNGLNPDEAYYVHGTSLVIANVAPAVPGGVAKGATKTSSKNFACRWIQDYDPQYLRDRSIVSAFYGSMEVRDERNPDGSWMYEEDDYQEDADFPLKVDGTPVDRVSTGTRKNVRMVKITTTGTGSVLNL